MQPDHPLIETYEQILREKLPNLFRLYLNPHVTQTCFCLNRYVQSTWSRQNADLEEYQSFLANGFDEALSGAIKLARYAANMAGRSTTCLAFDASNRLGPYAAAPIAGGGMVEFLPGVKVVGNHESDVTTAVADNGPFGIVVLVANTQTILGQYEEALRLAILRDNPLLIICVDRETLATLRGGAGGLLQEFVPDIVIFDESFVDLAVPFSAFAARKTLFNHWNRRGKTTFHSTTYQPNTISSLHFMRCLAQADPDFYAAATEELRAIDADITVRGDYFRRLYSPSLYRLIHMTGFDTADIIADGDFVRVRGQRVFDAVSGVACSVRGHNPAAYAEEMRTLGGQRDCEAEVAERLEKSTNLECMLPAVSGATAVENALKLALVAQHPRSHVLALKAGFGGKTLLALTGTANPRYKERINPLYPDVLYVDPFADDAEGQIDGVLAKFPVAVVQVELIQAVGGVRRVPVHVIRHLEARRQQGGYLLLVDEIQTGMHRTGPFTLSGEMRLSPDLLLLGKGTSDMMFPFALVLYSGAVRDKVMKANPDLPAAIRKRYSYEFGYRTVLNVLHRAEELSLGQRVAASSALFARLLREGLSSCQAVREVRVYGLLIGIELNDKCWPGRLFRRQLHSLYLYSMLRHRRFPVLVGFCQYEPNVLKITPALTVEPEVIRQACATIIEVLTSPFHRLLATALGGLIRPFRLRRNLYEHGVTIPTHEPVAR
jgi:acetylornithine/succinyldiaminopimelate/putrescine aminotransferase